MNDVIYLIVALVVWVPFMVGARELLGGLAPGEEDLGLLAGAALIGSVLAAFWFVALPIVAIVAIGYRLLRFVTRYGHDRDIRAQARRDADA